MAQATVPLFVLSVPSFTRSALAPSRWPCWCSWKSLWICFSSLHFVNCLHCTRRVIFCYDPTFSSFVMYCPPDKKCGKSSQQVDVWPFQRNLVHSCSCWLVLVDWCAFFLPLLSCLGDSCHALRSQACQAQSCASIASTSGSLDFTKNL